MNNTQAPFFPSLLITLIPGIGDHRYWSLMDKFGSPTGLLSSDINTIPYLSDDAKALISDFQQRGEHSDLAQQAIGVIEEMTLLDGYIIDTEHAAYPQLLKEIHCPPPLLYVKGHLDNLHLPQLAIVGSRHATHGGLENTRRFSRHLARSGFTITSGLALGVDGAAHEATLEAGGRTIAVMATGIDSVYPQKHQHLARNIVEQGGTLFSEFRPKTPPKAEHFPRRNRLISGLSLGVLVVEAAIKSGSLITAQYALEQSREVFSIPGSIHNPQSKGCHHLLKQGATLVESSSDIVQQLSGMINHLASHNQPVVDSKPQQANYETLSREEQLLIEHIGYQPTNIDTLLQSTKMDSGLLSASLINLELKGWIKLSDWGYERV